MVFYIKFYRKVIIVRDHYIATEYAMSKGVGVADKRLPSFDKALLDAGVGNYNLVKLSSILPARCHEVKISNITNRIREGSLLPTAYATISADRLGMKIASAIAIGFPADFDKVGVIMEYSDAGISSEKAEAVVSEMVREAFDERGWELSRIKVVSVGATVEKEGTTVTTFACVAEW